MNKINSFLAILTSWYSRNKRVLPFRGIKDPYKIWISEILLQQTQMSRGMEFYKRFIKRFSTVQILAKTTWNDFLPYFEGLGYYNRGRNMLKAAKVIVEQYKGKFPQTEKELLAIPGIGPYTAKAILSFAYNKPVLPLDTNIKRILGRVFLGESRLPTAPLRHSGPEGEPLVLAQNLKIKRKKDSRPHLVPMELRRGRRSGNDVIEEVIIHYEKFSSSDSNQGMMDFGTAICLTTKPKCLECPLFKICIYGRKEKPYLYKRVKIKKEKYEKKYVMAEIYEGKKLLKYKGKLLGGYLAKGDERAFLKKLALTKMHLKISVRPAYKSWIDKSVKYNVHRCYVLSGV